MNELWQSDEFVDDNTLTVNINRLRKKLESIGVTDFLLTRRGRGCIDERQGFFAGQVAADGNFAVCDIVFMRHSLCLSPERAGNSLCCGLYSAGRGGGYWIEYARRRGFYRNLLEEMEELSPKYLIAEMLEEPSFSEGKVLCQVVREAGKSMNDHIALYKNASDEYREYIEAWVHEVKRPLRRPACWP